MSLFDLFRRNRGDELTAKAAHKRSHPPGMRVVFRGHGAATGMPEAGDTDRLTAGWATRPAPILSIIERKWTIMCARGREAAYNTDHGKQFLRLVRKNVVGSQGVVVVPTVLGQDGKADDLARKAIAAAWETWGLCPEVTGILTWRDVQRLSVQTVARDGEVFIRRLKGRRFGRFQYQLQLIDPVRVPVNYRTKLPNGNRIRAGIEFTAEGKPVAYYVRADLDEFLEAQEYAGEQYERIPAGEMLHLFLPEAINQPRGLSWMGTAITRLHHLSKYETAAVINARLGASKMGFFTPDPEALDAGDMDDDDAPELPMDAEPGAFEEVPYGYRFQEWNPQYPQGEFDTFVKAVLHSVSAGLGVSYSALTGDLSGANYSSMRGGALEEREEWKDLQEWFVHALVRPVFEEFVAVAVLAQAVTIGPTPLRIERVDQYKRARYQGRRWAWVDPSKDIKAARDAHAGRIRSVSETIREGGRDPEEVFEEIAEEMEKMRELRILPEPVAKSADVGTEDKESTENADKNQADD